MASGTRVSETGTVSMEDVIVGSTIEERPTDASMKSINVHLRRLLAAETVLVEQCETEIRRLTAELADVEERERDRLRDLLHDHVQQLLAAARLRVNLLAAYTVNDAARCQAVEANALIDQAIAATRSLSADLYPAVLVQNGLAAGLRWLAEWVTTQHRLRVRVRARPAADPAAPEVRVLVYQAVRELLFNAAKHSCADWAVVWQRRTTPVMGVILVADRGRGFDASAVPTGTGLASVRQRVEAVGGHVAVMTAPGRGTRVAVRYPLR